MKNDEQLDQLKKINEDITVIEQKLKTIPGGKKQFLKQHKKDNSSNFITRREFVTLFQSVQKIRDRLYYVDVLTSAMEKVLIGKNIFTEDELEKTIKLETEKSLVFQDIQQGQKDYENRIKKCIEVGVDPDISIIGQQIYEDEDMSLADKKSLAETYNLKTLLNILNAE